MKVVVSKSDKFDLSYDASYLYSELSGVRIQTLDDHKIPRHCPHLIKVVTEMGINADYNLPKVGFEVVEITSNKYLIYVGSNGKENILTPESQEIYWSEKK